MNIAIFTNNYLPNPFGVTGSIESFRKQFEKMGNQVYIFAPHYKNYDDKNPCVFRYPAIDIEFKIKFPLAVPYSPKMDTILDKLEIDIVHSQHPNLLGSAAKKWAKKKNVPLVFTWHTLYDQYAHFVPIIPDWLVSRYIISRAVRYANSCDYVIAPTRSVVGIIRKWGVVNENITDIPTGVEPEDFDNPDRIMARKKRNVSDDEILLVLVSRLTAEKNVGFLFDSMIPLMRKNPRIKFLVAGDGNLVPMLKAIASRSGFEKRFIFEGIASRHEVKNIFSAGDIFIYSSKSETQGMILSEAMYVGLPIVAVDATGVCDLVENDINGFLVTDNNEKFADAVEKLVLDRELRVQFGKESARIAREKYTSQVCAAKMMEVYKKSIELKAQNS